MAVQNTGVRKPLRTKVNVEAIVSVRMSETEKSRMVEYCKERAMTISSFMRVVSIAAMKSDGVEV